jgi:hypothetical protein
MASGTPSSSGHGRLKHKPVLLPSHKGPLTLYPGVLYANRHWQPARTRFARAASDAAAVLILGAYIGLPYLLLLLAVASVWYPSALAVLLLLAHTVLLPTG